MALNKMFLYVKIGSKEVGWMGTLLDEREEKDEFFLKDVFLAEQEVSAVTTNLTPDGVAEMMNELMLLPDAMEVCNNLKFWGHSHVNMGVGPSAQDKETVVDLRGDTTDYFLRGIFNKKGEVKFTLFLYDRNVVIDDIDWFVEEDQLTDLEAEIKKEFDEKVSEAAPTYVYHQGGHTYGNSYNNHYGNTYGANRWTQGQHNRTVNTPGVRRWNHVSNRWEDENGDEIIRTGQWGYVNGVYRELSVKDLEALKAEEVSEGDAFDDDPFSDDEVEAAALGISVAELQQMNREIEEDEAEEIDLTEMTEEEAAEIYANMTDYDFDLQTITDEELEELADNDEEYLEFLNLKYTPGYNDPARLKDLIGKIMESDGSKIPN